MDVCNQLCDATAISRLPNASRERLPSSRKGLRLLGGAVDCDFGESTHVARGLSRWKVLDSTGTNAGLPHSLQYANNVAMVDRKSQPDRNVVLEPARRLVASGWRHFLKLSIPCSNCNVADAGLVASSPPSMAEQPVGNDTATD